MNNESLKIVHGIPESMRETAAGLYDEAFGAKFALAISSKTHRLSLLTKSLNLPFAFAAIEGEKLLALAGFKTKNGSFTGGLTVKHLFKELGALKGTWAIVVFSLYERSLKPGELLMDGIVVDSSRRGEGIGSQLLAKLCSFAKANEYANVRLDVIDANPSARRMYERNGFVPTKTKHFEYLRWFLGFGASITLLRKV